MVSSMARASALALSVVAGLTATACSTARQEHVFEGRTMGTTYTVKVVAEPLRSAARRAIANAIEAALDDVNSKMSTYIESSELNAFNRHRSEEPFPLSPETLQVLLVSKRVHRASLGAFDPTVGPLVDLWGFGSQPAAADLPTDEQIEALLPHLGFDKLELDLESGTARKLDPDVSFDLSAVAKGFAVDKTAEALAGLGYPSTMVELGGEVRAMGANAAGNPWRIAVERPGISSPTPQQIVPLSELSLATSGDYRNFFERDDRRYSHTIDPRTGQPVQHSLASASVLDRTCARADAWATAMMVLGPEEGWNLAVERDLAVLLVIYTDDGLVERMTPSFQAFLDRAID